MWGIWVAVFACVLGFVWVLGVSCRVWYLVGMHVDCAARFIAGFIVVTMGLGWVLLLL